MYTLNGIVITQFGDHIPQFLQCDADAKIALTCVELKYSLIFNLWLKLLSGCHLVVTLMEFINEVVAISGFPQGLENRENREKNNGQGKVREKSGNFILGQKSGKSQGILF